MGQIGGRRSCQTALVLCTALCLLSTSAAAQPDYVPEDVRITGKAVHVFSDRTAKVSVVLGDFSLSMGNCSVSGRDAVIWVQDVAGGSGLRHEITAYVEGGAKVVEPGSTTADRSMLVRLFHDGRLMLGGPVVQSDLADFPLYKRAAEARQSWSQPQPLREQGRQAPLLLASPPSPPAPTTAQATAPADEPQQPDEAQQRLPQPVSYSADSLSYRVLDDGRGAIVAKGNVYLSQGDPDSDLFLELRAQAGVIFLQSLPPENQRQPASAATPVATVDLPAAGRQYVAGVYLEGDVVASRGEQTVTASSAYYDFVTDRAIIVEPVFRTIHKTREIPIYVRAAEARALGSREVCFRDAVVTSSDFYRPTFYLAARTACLQDTSPYDEQQVRLGPQSWRADLSGMTFNVLGLPLLYWPQTHTDFEEGHTPVRRVQAGHSGRFGYGVETDWHLFRLLGLISPSGVRDKLSLDWYERGLLGGISLEYLRTDGERQYSGYTKLFGLIDNEGEDDFGRQRRDIPAPEHRGRALIRHKELLPGDLEMQAELSYLCDRNFLEEFFRNEFYAGKEQETLVYAKRQRDNWALTALLQYRLNDFQTQTESWPELGAHLLGEPLLGDRATLYSSSTAGIKRYRPDDDLPESSSRLFARLDSREEIDVPLHAGPVSVVPYAVGRLSYWDDTPGGGSVCRPYGQVGLRANMHAWRVYDSAQSRLLDVNRLKHVITPELSAFAADDGNVGSGQLYPMDAGVEEPIGSLSGVSAALYQRLQTKRGQGENEHTVDWMRLNISAAIFTDGRQHRPRDGRWFSSRPEHSIARDHVAAEYSWSISDATVFLADATYDLAMGRVARANAGLAVSRDPRLRYYLGIRYIDELDSAAATAGLNYRINSKYTLSVFEQYDFAHSGQNLATAVTIIRKFPRWYGALTFAFDRAQDSIGLFLTIWPEGAPEVQLGTGRIGLLANSSEN